MTPKRLLYKWDSTYHSKYFFLRFLLVNFFFFLLNYLHTKVRHYCKQNHRQPNKKRPQLHPMSEIPICVNMQSPSSMVHFVVMPNMFQQNLTHINKAMGKGSAVWTLVLFRLLSFCYGICFFVLLLCACVNSKHLLHTFVLSMIEPSLYDISSYLPNIHFLKSKGKKGK